MDPEIGLITHNDYMMTTSVIFTLRWFKFALIGIHWIANWKIPDEYLIDYSSSELSANFFTSY